MFDVLFKLLHLRHAEILFRSYFLLALLQQILIHLIWIKDPSSLLDLLSGQIPVLSAVHIPGTRSDIVLLVFPSSVQILESSS